MNRAGAPVARGEEGASLVMAMIVMMVLTTLSMALMGRTLSVMNYVRAGQDYDAALAAADAGLADALFKIDQSAPASWTATGSAGAGGTFQYFAEKHSESKYVVSSIGTVGDSRHGIQALVTRSAQFPYALFSNQRLRFAGTTATGLKVNFYSFNRLFGQSDRVRVGSNDTVICEGPPDPNVFIDWYTTQSDCTSERVQQLEKPRDISITVPPEPHQDCPADGIFGVSDALTLNLHTVLDLSNPTVAASIPETVIDGKSYVQPGGVPFVCRQNVKLRGLITPENGPVKIYILPTVHADGSKTYHSLDVSEAIVNPLSPASNFQIFKDGGAPMTSNGVTTSNLTFRGVIFAPETPMTINGGLWWAGSFTFSQLDVQGANIKIGYDFDLDTYLGPDWRVSRYREISSTEAVPASMTTTTTTPASSTTSSTAPSSSTTTTPAPTTTTTLAPTTTTTTCTLNALGVCI